MIKEFETNEPLEQVIRRADADDVKFAVNYKPKTDRLYVEFHAPEGVSLVEVEMVELLGIARMFDYMAKKVKRYRLSKSN